MKKLVSSLALLLAVMMAVLSIRSRTLAQTVPTHLKDYGLKSYLHLSQKLPHSESAPWKLVCTMPYNCHFQPWIELESSAGKAIQFNSSNPLVLYLTPTESYTTRAGVQQVEAQKWVSGEGAIYTIPAGVTVRAVQYRETGYDTSFVGSFECDDNDYNILWKKEQATDRMTFGSYQNSFDSMPQ